MDQAANEVFEVIAGCERHGHHPETLHVTTAFLRRLFAEEVPAYDKEGLEEQAERRDKLMRGEGVLCGYPFVVHPTQPDVWVHDDEASPAPASPS